MGKVSGVLDPTLNRADRMNQLKTFFEAQTDLFTYIGRTGTGESEQDMFSIIKAQNRRFAYYVPSNSNDGRVYLYSIVNPANLLTFANFDFGVISQALIYMIVRNVNSGCVMLRSTGSARLWGFIWSKSGIKNIFVYTNSSLALNICYAEGADTTVGSPAKLGPNGYKTVTGKNILSPAYSLDKSQMYYNSLQNEDLFRISSNTGLVPMDSLIVLGTEYIFLGGETVIRVN